MSGERVDAASEFDVVIAGGGLAGQALARHLKLYYPETKVAVIDKLVRPLPEAAFKVGESTIIISAHYYQTVLKLGDYLFTKQLRKLGLRYFYGDGRQPVATRPEMGKSSFHHLLNEWQLDRGMFENDLRTFNQQLGVELIEGANITDIRLSSDDAPHELSYVRDGSTTTVRGRWLVDASGRRCLLGQKFGTGPERVNMARSAAWWRVKGRVDVANLVPRDNVAWHDCVPGDNRFNSTTHMMGKGYWVWLIPLSSGVTSVGIVATDSIHPPSTYNTLEKAMAWLDEHEPHLAHHLRRQFPEKPLDFKVLKDFAYRNTQVVSAQRWACVGEAAGFADPFYSPGSDSISMMNGMVVDMIRVDREGKLTEEMVQRWQQLFQDWLAKTTFDIHTSYPYMHNPMVMSCRTLWDWCYTASTNLPLFHGTFFKGGFVDNSRVTKRVFSPERERLIALGKRMVAMINHWGELSKGERSFKNYLQYVGAKPLIELIMTTLNSNDPTSLWPTFLERLEEIAQAFFRIAVEDVLPKQLATLPRWVNVWAVSLDPSKWEADGLFKPESEARDYTMAYENIRDLVTGKLRLEGIIRHDHQPSAPM
ncbi:MAG TPA: tryptophan 7-halogenase [Hyalangium sp.]|nr:tryptophan 7-halogenase [Hyalangium sp.]